MPPHFRVALPFAFAAALPALVTTLADCSHSSSDAAPSALEDATLTLNLRASVPRWSDAPFVIRDPKTGMTLESRLRESRHRLAETNRAGIIYRDAVLGGGDIAFRATESGAEDFVELPSPTTTSLSYELALDSHVAGLRLVANSLELLDSNGFPRLRVQSPYLIDSSRKRLPIALSVEGCAISTNPAAPFHKSVLAPGSHACILHLTWDALAASYPVIVDPGWMTTDALALARFEHIAVLLSNGDVMVAGGQTGDPLSVEVTTATTEIYSGGVWAASGPMAGDRAIAAAATLANGNVLVTGGLSQAADGAQTILGTSEIYDVASGMWSATGSLTDARSGHTATAVGDGTVIVAGGYNNSGAHYDSAELYSAGNFTPAGTINTARFDHIGVTLPGNRVLLGAGTNAFTGALASIELYTAGIGWSAASALTSMSQPRLLVSGAALQNGDVVFIGGYNDTDFALASSETYRPSTNTWTTGSGTLLHARYHAVAATLSNGQVLVVGGEDGNGNYRDAELYDPTSTQFSDFCGMSEASAYGHTVTALSGSEVMVAGGHGYKPSRILNATSIFDLTVDGGPTGGPDGGWDLEDASACDHPPDVIVDSGSDAAPDSGEPLTDASAERDADTDGSTPSKHPDRSDAASSDADLGAVAAGGGCTMSPRAPGDAPDDEGRSSPVFFAGFAIMFVLIRSRRWHHFARRFRPYF